MNWSNNRPQSTASRGGKPETLESLVRNAVAMEKLIRKQDDKIKELNDSLTALGTRLTALEEQLGDAVAKISALEREKAGRDRRAEAVKELFSGEGGMLPRMGHMISDGLSGMSAEMFTGAYVLPILNLFNARPGISSQSGNEFYAGLLAAVRPVLDTLTAADFKARATADPELIPATMRRMTEALRNAGVSVVFPADDPSRSYTPGNLPAGHADIPAIVRDFDKYIYAYGGKSTDN